VESFLEMENHICCPTCPEDSNILVRGVEELQRQDQDPLPRLNLVGQVNEDVKAFLAWALELESRAAEKEEEGAAAAQKKNTTRREEKPKNEATQKSAKQKAKPRRSRFSKMEA
jgi:hypothetical protein